MKPIAKTILAGLKGPPKEPTTEAELLERMSEVEYPRRVWDHHHRQYFTEVAPGKFHGFPRKVGAKVEVRPGVYRDYSLQLSAKGYRNA